MYEIWLVINILWESALTIWPVLVAAAVAWVVLAAAAARRPARAWRSARSLALGVGVVAAVVAFLAVPGLVKSSLSELAYWVDWANLLAIAVGVGVVAVAFAWPAAALRASPRGG
jgi:hypothetical protein